MIIKSFNLSELKKTESNFFLFYGENDGLKEETISNYFLKNFNGEIVRYDENQILENKDFFLETCLNESLFETNKVILVLRVTSKMIEIIRELTSKKIYNKKIIFISQLLEKRSKIRQFFETEKNLICIAFYQENSSSLYKIAYNFFKTNNISISSENINLILEKCSGDRKNLQNEMNKILNFCFKKNKISREEINKLIISQEDENYFELIDFCLSMNHFKVINIINNNSFNKNDTIILIRSFLSRLKRLLELKKSQKNTGNIKKTVDFFKPNIFWKDKEIVQKQMEIWTIEKIYILIEELNKLELNFKKNYELSNNLIFDLILNTSKNSNS
tara:strand:- start:10198 stop:11193 length:996 start_codon:yes stop_codon:yes gene_type:complete